jgi:hypothetical protein
LPAAGPSQAAKISAALSSAASMVDADRSDFDEADVAARVAEHCRPLDPRGLADVGRGNFDMLAARAESLRSRAPFAPRLPQAPSARERSLRHYMASFGIECPPRAEGEREKTVVSMAHAFDKLLGQKLRASVVYVWGPAPEETSVLGRAVRKLRARHIEVRWIQPAIDLTPTAEGSVQEAVYAAVSERAELAQERAVRVLKRLGAKQPKLRRATSAQGEPIPATTEGRLLVRPDEPDESPPSSAPPSSKTGAA